MAILLSTLMGVGASETSDDAREFKNHQDWYGQFGGQSPTQSTRDPGLGTGAQNRYITGTASFTVPSGVSKIRVTCIGGGGGTGR